MKNQALFSSKDKSEKCRLLQFLFGALRVKILILRLWLLQIGKLPVNHHTTDYTVTTTRPEKCDIFAQRYQSQPKHC